MNAPATMKSAELLLSACLCGSVRTTRYVHNEIPVARCDGCGLERQDVYMTPQQYSGWYEKRYHDECVKHTLQQDRDVALMRLSAYQIPAESSLLDIGSGNGAFVEKCVAASIDAYGVDLANVSTVPERTYLMELGAVHFPTDHFDVVTIHDVAEHVPDLLGMLREIERITKTGGRVIIDIPDFSHDHHWRAIQHIWMLYPDQLIEFAQSCGLVHDNTVKPIPSKWVIEFSVPEKKRTTILVPPGIGDSYWSLVKIQSFCEVNDLGIPDVRATSMDRSKDRCADFVSRAPFVHFKGYANFIKRDRTWKPLWREAYFDVGRTIFEDVAGHDYFISYNGITRHGHAIDDWDTEYATDWHYPMFQPLAEQQFADNIKAEYGDYIVAYFIDHGMYRNWLKEFTVDDIKDTMERLHAATGKRIAITGSSWDDNPFSQAMSEMVPDDVMINLIGKTNIDELFGLLRNASGVVGFPSGTTIISAAFGTPTVMIWNKYFNRKFWAHACPPDSIGTNYLYHDSTDRPEAVVASLMQLIGD